MYTMETDNKSTQALITPLTSPDYGVRLIALGKLVEAGETAVPALLEALKRPDSLLRACAACALAGIGTPRAALPLVAFWEADPSNPSAIEALSEYAGKLAREPRTEDIPALLELLPCYKATISNVVVGLEISTLAAEALSKLARTAPTPPLRAALPLLKRDIWHSSPEGFGKACEAIKEATHKWKDLPVTAFAPQPKASELPLPAEIPERS
jgi:HEAT repeat protein